MRPATLIDLNFDGLRALETVIASSAYGSIHQAIASLTVFAHPETCKQASNQNIFLVIRDMPQRGKYTEDQSPKLMYCDNYSPTAAFCWAHGITKRPKDIQFCHIYSESSDYRLYTNLCNIVIIPAFLAKLSDTHKEISELLQYRSYELYGFLPEGYSEPKKPNGYDSLKWAEPLAPVRDLQASYRKAMSTRIKDRTANSARLLGWYFSNFQSDPSL
jgi:hypothetical protein